MIVAQEVDKWIYDLEQQLKSGNFTNRGKLQRKIIQLTEVRDRVYNRKVNSREGKLEQLRMIVKYSKYCRERFIPKPPPPQRRKE